MSELAVKRAEALNAINLLLNNTAEGKYATIHEVNVLALGIKDTLLENNALEAVHVITQGRGKPQVRQRYYDIKVEDLRVAMGDLLDDMTQPEEKIVDQELPSYLLEEGDDE